MSQLPTGNQSSRDRVAAFQQCGRMPCHAMATASLLLLNMQWSVAQTTDGADATRNTVRQTGSIAEVVVSARKRVENLQDVPISISAVAGEDLRQNGVQRIEYLAPSIPNFHYAQVPTGSDQIFIRGIGSGNNFGFEMAVGQAIDGFYYGRSRLGRAAFLDLERLEILKGPQGAILGKNNTAGAINLTTAKPTENFEAALTTTVNIENNPGYGFDGFVSGALTDTLKGRLALRYDAFDGYFKNEALGRREQSSNDVTGRGTLVWDANEDFSITASYQRADFDRGGHPRELFHCGPVLASMLQGADCDLNYVTAVNGPVRGVSTQDQFEQTQDMLHVTMSWDLAGHDLTSLTGYMQYDANDAFDGDSTPTENRGFRAEESYSQWLQELRLTSTGQRALDYTVGAFFMVADQQSDFFVDYATNGQTRAILSQQDTTTMAGFAELTWHAASTVDLTVGGRYTAEKKELDQLQYGAALYTSQPAVTFPTGPARHTHRISPERSESEFSPTFDARWRPHEDVMLYGSVRRGFKGGGFNMMLDAPQATALGQVHFEEEKVTAYELGTKLDLWDHSARLNIAAFRSEFDDIQESIFISFGQFQVGNAASAISQGLEAQFEWQPLHDLLLKADVAYLDAYWDDYQDAPCYASQSPATGCVLNNGGRVQDLSGQRMYNAPRLAAAVSGTYTWDLTNDLLLTTFMEVMHRGSHSIASDNDPVMYQKGYELVNARIALSNASESWQVAVIGRNLTDELVMINGSDTSPDAFAAFLLPPRIVELQATLRF